MNYREMLRDEYLKRNRKNARYSMRSFAKDLGLSSGYLTQVLKGQRNLSEVKAIEVAENMGFSLHRRRAFQSMVSFEKSRDEKLQSKLKAEIDRDIGSLSQVKEIKLAQFEVISHWYHFALLELTKVEGFVHCRRWIARQLGITFVEVDHAIRNLKKLGLLKEEDGHFTKLERDYLAGTGDVPSEAIVNYHRDVLNLAKEALRRHTPDKREFFSVVAAFDPDQIGFAKERIRKFQEELMQEMETARPKKLYQVAVQMFPLGE